MRKKLLVSVCAAVVLVAALWSPAFAVVTLDGPSSVSSGGTVEFTIRGSEMGMSAVIETTGLEFEKAEGGMSEEAMVLLLADYGGMEAKYTYKVTAAQGQPVSFALTEVTESDGRADSYAPTLTWSGTVGGAISTTEGPQPTRTNQPIPTETLNSNAGASQPAATLPPSSQAPGAATTDQGAAGAVVTTDPASQPTDGPKTGDNTVSVWIWWIVGIACAIIAIFAGRKAFERRKHAGNGDNN